MKEIARWHRVLSAYYLRRGIPWIRIAQSEEKEMKPKNSIYPGLLIYVAKDSVAVHTGKGGNGIYCFWSDPFSDF